MPLHFNNKDNSLMSSVVRSLLPAATLLIISTTFFPACRSIRHRDQTPLLTLAAVGDIYARIELFDGRDPLEEVRSLLTENDLFIFNMEGVLLSQDPPEGTCHKFPSQSLFWSPSSIADFLHPTRRTIATMGNNHILDCGAFGIRDTLFELAGRGILTVGAGENKDSACRPLTLEANGIRMAILSYLSMSQNPFSAGTDRAGTGTWEACSAENSIARMAAATDLVIVVLHLHLGKGWTDRTPPEHIALARRALEAGADIVIAHGPHVPQGILVEQGGVAFLSLGNFLFRPEYSMYPPAHDSLMVKVSVLPRRLEVRLLPLILDLRGMPMVATEREALWMLERLADLSAPLGASIEISNGMGRCTVQR